MTVRTSQVTWMGRKERKGRNGREGFPLWHWRRKFWRTCGPHWLYLPQASLRCLHPGAVPPVGRERGWRRCSLAGIHLSIWTMTLGSDLPEQILVGLEGCPSCPVTSQCLTHDRPWLFSKAKQYLRVCSVISGVPETERCVINPRPSETLGLMVSKATYILWLVWKVKELRRITLIILLALGI